MEEVLCSKGALLCILPSTLRRSYKRVANMLLISYTGYGVVNAFAVGIRAEVSITGSPKDDVIVALRSIKVCKLVSISKKWVWKRCF